jgi:membrane protease YdiL (CAAX protease family)
VLNDFLFIRFNGWLGFLIVDYATRLLVLALLLVPALRSIAFRREPLDVSPTNALILMLGCVALDQICVGGLLPLVSLAIEHTRLFHYPPLPPGIKQVDLLLGIMLVAISEELLCRRCAKYVLRLYLRSDARVIAVSAALFGAMHWSHGVPAIMYTAFIGAIFMAVYLRVGTLWPIVGAHYLIDVIAFW